jgi:hypothetical protein
MKTFIFALFLVFLAGSTSAQFSDTAQFNTYVRDTIRDRRPDKVTAAQIQKGFLGVSGLIPQKYLKKAGNGLSVTGDSISLGGDFFGSLGLYGEGRSSVYITYSNPDESGSGNLLLDHSQINPYVYIDPNNKNEMYMKVDKTTFTNTTGGVENNVYFTTDSFYIGSTPSYDIGEYTKFRVSKDGYVRLPRFKNNSSEDSVLITDKDGNLKQRRLQSPTGIQGMVQYKSGTGGFGGSPSFVWDEVGNSLNINGIEGGVMLSPDGYISISNSNPSAATNIVLSNDQGNGFQLTLGGSEFSNKTVLSSSLPLEIGSSSMLKLTTSNNFIGGTKNPTAKLHIAAGSNNANTAPIKLTAGTLMSTPENGAIEFDGIHFYATIGSTRYQLDQLILKVFLSFDFPNIANNSSSSTTVSLPGAAVGDIVEISSSDASGWQNGETYTAWVSSINTVTVRLNNYSGEEMDLPERNFNIIVRKF